MKQRLSWGNRTAPNFIGIILIKVCSEETTTAKYNSNTARHCSIQFEAQCRKSVYFLSEEDNIVCVQRYTARGVSHFSAVHVIECIQKRSLSNFRGFQAKKKHAGKLYTFNRRKKQFLLFPATRKAIIIVDYWVFRANSTLTPFQNECTNRENYCEKRKRAFWEWRNLARFLVLLGQIDSYFDKQ